MAIHVAWQALQHGLKGLQTVRIQLGKRLPRAVTPGQFKCTGAAFAAVLQQAEFAVQQLKVGLADEAEPAV